MTRDPFSSDREKCIRTKGDTYIDQGDPDDHHGTTSTLTLGDTSGGSHRRPCIQIKFPEEPPDAGRIIDATLKMYMSVQNLSLPQVLVVEGPIDDFSVGYTDGTTPSGAFGATWNNYDGRHGWEDRDDAAPRCAVLVHSSDVGDFIDIPIINLVYECGLTWGSTIDVILRFDGEPDNQWVGLNGVNIAAKAYNPRLEITYELKPAEIPDAEDEILTIEPNPSNPEQPILKWEKPDGMNLRIDSSGSYCLVKHDDIIDDITDGTLIARLNHGEEFVDDGSILATNENDIYYYVVYFCSESDYIEGTGTGAMSGMTVTGGPVASNMVWMIRPDVSTFSVVSGTPDVKEQVTGTITAITSGDFASTPSPVQHTKYQYDWKGDSSEVGWVELETPANSHVKTHYYLSSQGATNAKCRIQNSLGFWSDATNSSTTVTVSAITPTSIVNVAPKRMVADSSSLRVLGNKSYDRNANGTISKYEFRVVRGSDAYEWDSSTQDWLNSTQWENLGTTPYMDIPIGKMDTAATYTCYCRVTSSVGGLGNTDSTTVVVETSAPIIMEDVLTSSSFEAYNLGRKRTKVKHKVLEGSAETIIDEGAGSPTFRLRGKSKGKEFQEDVNQLYTWEDNDTLLRVYTDPQASPSGRYIDGRIANLKQTKKKPMGVDWVCDFVVENASL
jgi:hypothetical protein